MIRTSGGYVNQRLELDQPLELKEGTRVEIQILPCREEDEAEREGWFLLSMSRLEEEWDNPQEAVYDDWKYLYGVGSRR